MKSITHLLVSITAAFGLVACQTTGGIKPNEVDPKIDLAAWKNTNDTQLGKVVKHGGMKFDYPVTIPSNAPWIASDYGDTRNHRGQQRTSTGGIHRGIDIGAPVGYPIIAAADGYVSRSRRNSGNAGNFIAILHKVDGAGPRVVSTYSHLSKLFVYEGQNIQRGQLIGTLGNTGKTAGYPHLHFGIEIEKSIGSLSYKLQNTHDYWHDGPGKISCFEKGKWYRNNDKSTYPLPCQ